MFQIYKFKDIIMKEIKGNLVSLAKSGEFDVIVHGCNCFCAMGAGIAAEIKDEFPLAYKADLATEKGAISKLGTYSQATETMKNGHHVTVINAYTQYGFGNFGIKLNHERKKANPEVLFEYDAFEKILHQLKSEFKGKRIGFPFIGSGLAKGNKAKIDRYIKAILKDEDVTMVEFQP